MTNEELRDKFITVLKQIEDGESLALLCSGSYHDEFNSDNEEFSDHYFGKFKDHDLRVEGIDGYGGESKGDEYWGVIRVTDKTTNHHVYLKIDGYYASYHGADFNDRYDFCLVTAATKQIKYWK